MLQLNMFVVQKYTLSYKLVSAPQLTSWWQDFQPCETFTVVHIKSDVLNIYNLFCIDIKEV